MRLFRSYLTKLRLHWFLLVYIFLVFSVMLLFLPSYSLQLEIYGKVTDQSYLLRDTNTSHYIKPSIETHFTDVPKDFLSYARLLGAYRSLGVFVTSDVRHRDRRRAIRATWGRVLRPKPVFILGKSSNPVDNEIAEEEAELYKDVIIEDFNESYQNLTIKTMFALKHFLRLMPDEKYFLKIDDDVFLNVFNLNKIMKKYENFPPGIIGHLESQRFAHRDRESKWFTPRWMFTEEKLPDFINGPAYLISGQVVRKIYNEALSTTLLTLEDVFLTGIVANAKLQVPLYQNDGFEDYYSIDNLINRDCFYRSVLTIHRMTNMEQMIDVWKRLKKNHEPCWEI
ncbi:beta-1,3-galactosyltransferase 1-like [Culicoides brevitarsis]|uniref:beta-1,3-galactosyltransferase 1-like n=1 Tax=Culicoides brevitarsis TaxID=469753 RepID=UPI00307B8C5A